MQRERVEESPGEVTAAGWLWCFRLAAERGLVMRLLSAEREISGSGYAAQLLRKWIWPVGGESASHTPIAFTFDSPALSSITGWRVTPYDQPGVTILEGAFTIPHNPNRRGYEIWVSFDVLPPRG